MTVNHGFLRVRTAIFRTPWAIVPDRLELILAYLEARANGVTFEAPKSAELQAEFQAAESRVMPEQGIAVIPISGTITHRTSNMDSLSGGDMTSANEIVRRTRAAVQDQRVSAIIHHYHSPGGTVDGVPEAYDSILAMRGEKPIVAIADTMIGSAAYYMAAAADEIVVTPSGQVGSIGVFAVHEDFSEQYRQLGEERTLIASSKFKGEGLDFLPMTDDYREHLENQVLAYDDMFVSAVAEGRGVSEKRVRNEFGQGRMVMAEPAVAAGMADRVETFDALVERLQAGCGRKRRRMRAESGASVAARMKIEVDSSEVTKAVAQIEALNEATKAGAVTQVTNVDSDEAIAEIDSEDKSRALALTDNLENHVIGQKQAYDAALFSAFELRDALIRNDLERIESTRLKLIDQAEPLSEQAKAIFAPIIQEAVSRLEARGEHEAADSAPARPVSLDIARRRLRLRGQGPGRTG